LTTHYTLYPLKVIYVLEQGISDLDARYEFLHTSYRPIILLIHSYPQLRCLISVLTVFIIFFIFILSLLIPNILTVIISYYRKLFYLVMILNYASLRRKKKPFKWLIISMLCLKYMETVVPITLPARLVFTNISCSTVAFKLIGFWFHIS
jgi:hypothetical protein